MKLQQELTSLLNTAGFTLRKWASNHSACLDTIPTELQETQQTLSLDKEDGVTTLGFLWDPAADQLQFKNIKQVQTIDSTMSTKRKLLAITESIFDPLGLLSPALIVYMIFLQKLWQDKLQLDELLPTHFEQSWNQLHQTIPQLSQIKIKRKVICSNATNIQLHEFCDSIERPYGACLSIPSNKSNKISCELLCFTSKIAPLKQMTIPNWNYVRATLLSMLYKKAINAFNLPVNDSHLWIDISLVLT